MKTNQTDFLNILGIGAFAFLAILEFSGFVQYAAMHLSIVVQPESNATLWLPDLIGLIVFTISLVWLARRCSTPINIKTRKTLIILIILLSGMIIIQYLYVFFATSLLANNFEEAFNAFYKIRQSNIELQIFTAYIPVL